MRLFLLPTVRGAVGARVRRAGLLGIAGVTLLYLIRRLYRPVAVGLASPGPLIAGVPIAGVGSLLSADLIRLSSAARPCLLRTRSVALRGSTTIGIASVRALRGTGVALFGRLLVASPRIATLVDLVGWAL